MGQGVARGEAEDKERETGRERWMECKTIGDKAQYVSQKQGESMVSEAEKGGK